MIDIPDETVGEPSNELVEQVAAIIYGKPHCDNHPCEGCDYEREEARMYLRAITPLIRADERQKIVAEMRAEIDKLEAIPYLRTRHAPYVRGLQLAIRIVEGHGGIAV